MVPEHLQPSWWLRRVGSYQTCLRIIKSLTKIEYGTSTIVFKQIWYACKGLTGKYDVALQWSHNGCDGVSNHQHRQCLLNRLFRRRSKKTPKLRVTGLYRSGEFPAQVASNTKKIKFDDVIIMNASINILISERYFKNIKRPFTHVVYIRVLGICQRFDTPRRPYDDVIKWKHFRATGPLCGEFTGHRWIPLTKVNGAELWSFLWSAPEQTVE